MNCDQARRKFLAGLVTAMAARPALGAALTALCPNDPSISDPAGTLLTVDTHAHFFNGSDLQVRQFLSRVFVGRDSELFPLVDALADLLQHLGWRHAPSAKAELTAISRYASQAHDCAGIDPMRRLASSSYQAGYRVGRRELRAAADALYKTPTGASVLGPKKGASGLGAAIASLPPTYDEYEAQSLDAASILGSNPTFRGYIRFLLHNFNYRHVNAIDYLTTYSKGSPRKVDLVAASLMDYDWWLACGRATPSSLQDQVNVMGRISVLLGGRVHGFVPFCPFRELMTKDSRGTGDAMRLVKRAIEQSGFIGVKLYPPMGFAAWGNTGQTIWRDNKRLPPAAREANFGERLDAAMHDLFTYCIANDVPIMAHANHSNGPSDEYKDLAGSKYWKLALGEFRGLRVAFGHFGDTDLENHNGEKTLPFLELMTSGPGTSGVNAFADSGYFAGTLIDQDKMSAVLRTLYSANNGVLLDRMMYGTDWTMILTQKNVDRYLLDFIAVMDRVVKEDPGIRARGTTLQDAFFGRNAVEFLGLNRGRGNRGRLELFYSQNKVGQPDWMHKIG